MKASNINTHGTKADLLKRLPDSAKTSGVSSAVAKPVEDETDAEEAILPIRLELGGEEEMKSNAQMGAPGERTSP